MLNDTELIFVYNQDNRLSRVLNQTGNVKEEYVYDHSGSRKAKLTVLDGVNKTSLYLGDRLLEIFTNGSIRDTIYIYANNELLAKKVVDGETTYYHPDHLGSTTVISDIDGDLVERISYRPYGQPRQSSEEFYQFTSQEWNGDLGIYDYNARQYNPILKRFLQADSILPNVYDPQQLNRYSYVNNNPLKYTDPSGHLAFLLGVAGFLKTVTIACAIYFGIESIDSLVLGGESLGTKLSTQHTQFKKEKRIEPFISGATGEAVKILLGGAKAGEFLVGTVGTGAVKFGEFAVNTHIDSYERAAPLFDALPSSDNWHVPWSTASELAERFSSSETSNQEISGENMPADTNSDGNPYVYLNGFSLEGSRKSNPNNKITPDSPSGTTTYNPANSGVNTGIENIIKKIDGGRPSNHESRFRSKSKSWLRTY